MFDLSKIFNLSNLLFLTPFLNPKTTVLFFQIAPIFLNTKKNISNSFTCIGIMFKPAKQRFLAKRRNLFVLTSAFVLHHPIDVISYLSLPGDVRFGKSRSITSQFHSRSFANCQIAAWVQGRNHRWNWKEKKNKLTVVP